MTMQKMLVKICGMRDPDNIRQVLTLTPDFMGFIFYPRSPRYVTDEYAPFIQNINFGTTKKIGVFVNGSVDEVMNTVVRFGLDGVQLHGNEPAEECERLKREGLIVLKALGVKSGESNDTRLDLERTQVYQSVCDYLLFDTQTPKYGGTGMKFDWSVLCDYKGETPYLLSGGISEDDVEDVKKLMKKLESAQLVGVDLNSKFEISPAMKDEKRLKTMLDRLRQK